MFGLSIARLGEALIIGAMSFPIVQVDAFVTEQPFSGNPAAVCLVDRDVDDAWLQSVALEMNLSETAFLWKLDDGYRLRWFTPAVEVDLCGHATLASAHVLFGGGHVPDDQLLRFHTRSGILTAARRGERIELDFPATSPEPAGPPDGVLSALGIGATDATYVARSRFDLFVRVVDAATVRSLAPDFGALRALDVRGVIVTAPSDDPGSDFISRFFAPGAGIDEDPVTGSAHCALAPYWAAELDRSTVIGFQASARGGLIECELVGDRVRLRGRAVSVLRGELLIGA